MFVVMLAILRFSCSFAVLVSGAQHANTEITERQIFCCEKTRRFAGSPGSEAAAPFTCAAAAAAAVAGAQYLKSKQRCIIQSPHSRQTGTEPPQSLRRFSRRELHAGCVTRCHVLCEAVNTRVFEVIYAGRTMRCISVQVSVLSHPARLCTEYFLRVPFPKIQVNDCLSLAPTSHTQHENRGDVPLHVSVYFGLLLPSYVETCPGLATRYNVISDT